MFESQKVIFFNFSANEMVNFVYKYESGFWEQYCMAWNRFYPRVWKRFSHIESAPFHAKTKMPSRCTFRLKFEKGHTSNESTQISQNPNFYATKKPLYLGPKMLHLVFLRYNFEYFESTHPNFSKGKVLLKNTSQ